MAEKRNEDTEEHSDCPYRPNVCMIIVDQMGRYLLGERAGESGHWQFPQGGMQLEHSLEENALRELEEELGAPAALWRIVAVLKSTHRYDFNSPRKYGGVFYRGQDQQFVLVRFLGSDQDLDLNRDKHPEFQAVCWCDQEQLHERAAPRRLKGYLAALSEVQKLLQAGE